jgi:hypothetical protein
MIERVHITPRGSGVRLPHSHDFPPGRVVDEGGPWRSPDALLVVIGDSGHTGSDAMRTQVREALDSSRDNDVSESDLAGS